MEAGRMSRVGRDVASALFGSNGRIGITRGVAEFYAGRPVLVSSECETVLALPLEGLDTARLREFTGLCAPALPCLIITERRAHALGLDADGVTSLSFASKPNAATILAFAAGAKPHRRVATKPAGAAAEAAIELAKLSQGLPAVLAAECANADAIARTHQIVVIEAESACFREETVRSLRIASRASVPLKSGSRASFVVFRNDMGESPVAIVVGKPE